MSAAALQNRFLKPCTAHHDSRHEDESNQLTGRAGWQSKVRPITVAGAAALGMFQVNQRSRAAEQRLAASTTTPIATNMVGIISGDAIVTGLLKLDAL
jgi:hypothetical protein